MSDTVIQPRPQGHPLAGERMSGARMIMQVLADEGVTAIFGYSGGGDLPTYDAVFLYKRAVRTLASRRFRSSSRPTSRGGFMGGGYARARAGWGCARSPQAGVRRTLYTGGDCMQTRCRLSNLRPSRDRGHRHRRIPGGAVPSIMGASRSIFLVTDPSQARATVRTAVRDRPHRRRVRVVDIPRRPELGGRLPGRGLLRFPANRPPHARASRRLDTPSAALFFAMLAESAVPSSTRRRRDQRQRRGRLTEFAATFGVRGDHAHGDRGA